MPRSPNSKLKKGNRRLNSTRTTKILVKRWIAEHGLEPLAVMLDNMKDSYEMAKTIEQQPELKPEDEQERLRYRQIAQEAARDAAPFVHPKLATTNLNAKVVGELAVTFVDDIPE